jgi:ABC-type uncharacterized transport system involved in gliding motility auxiliary subunit
MLKQIPLPVIGLIGLLLAVDGIASWSADAPTWAWGFPWALGTSILLAALSLRASANEQTVLTLAGASFAVLIALVWFFGYDIGGIQLDHITSIVGFLAVSISTVGIGIYAMLQGRAAAEGANVWVYVVAGLAVIVLINYVAALHLGQRWDMTATKLQSLSQQTVAKLAGLDTDVEVVAFFRDDDPNRAGYAEMLKKYSDESSHFTFDVVDPDKYPDVARNENVEESPAVLLKCEDRRERVIGGAERALTSALIKVTRPGTPTIYFSSWHQERSLDTELTTLTETLDRINYEIKPWRLIDGEIPQDAELFVIAGPRGAFAPIELERLSDYLAQGRNLLVLLDPDTTTTGLEDLLKRHGAVVSPNFIVERQRGLVPHSGGYYMGEQQTVYARVSNYADNPIVRGMNEGGVMAGFYLARQVRWRQSPAPGMVESDGQSFVFAGSNLAFMSEKVGEVIENPRKVFEPETERGGPFSVAAAITLPATDPLTPNDVSSRLVVFGDSDFITDRGVAQEQGNLSLASNAITWLTEDEDLIAIQPRTPGSKPLRLTEAQGTFVFLFSIWRFPAFILVAGLVIWWYRRSRGPSSPTTSA